MRHTFVGVTVKMVKIGVHLRKLLQNENTGRPACSSTF